MKSITAFWNRIANRSQKISAVEPEESQPEIQSEIVPLDISTNDPLLAYVQSSPGVIDIESFTMDSPTIHSLRKAGIRLALPLVSQGELIGLINLGPRRSEQDYSSEDKKLLQNLATQAAPALRIAQLARQQQAEARQRERIEQELRVARVIQETLLPREIPAFPGWGIQAHWQPAREVSGDFYDFIQLEDGRMAVIIADVTDKGVPAAMVMATTRSILRATVERLVSPGKVLARANDLLHPDIPTKMFVTCLYLLLEPDSGKVVFANAGHNLPYHISKGQINELRATGMPLGLLPGMQYEEIEAQISSGAHLLLSSDGLVEAHNDHREMYGFERMLAVLAGNNSGQEIVPQLMQSWREFTGEGHEQEDDITLVTLTFANHNPGQQDEVTWKTVAEINIASQPGNERLAASQVVSALSPYALSEGQRKKLETAVAEATMNAMEHGNHYDPGKPVAIRVAASSKQIAIHITDQGGGAPIPPTTEPDLDAKLAGEQSPRGWGLFLIRNMVDDMQVSQDGEQHTIQLFINL